MKNTETSKGTPLDKQMRQNKILEMLSKGMSRLEIQNHLKSEYGVSQATLNSDFLKALAELQKQQEPFTTHIKEVIADRYEVLWDKAIDKGDLKTATVVLKQEADLFGLNVQRQEVAVDPGEFEITFN